MRILHKVGWLCFFLLLLITPAIAAEKGGGGSINDDLIPLLSIVAMSVTVVAFVFNTIDKNKKELEEKFERDLESTEKELLAEIRAVKSKHSQLLKRYEARGERNKANLLLIKEQFAASKRVIDSLILKLNILEQDISDVFDNPKIGMIRKRRVFSADETLRPLNINPFSSLPEFNESTVEGESELK